jgi:hypothetical protein
MMSEEAKLSVMLDGELGPKERAEMEAILARDTALKAKLAEMQRADDLVRAAYAAPMEEAVPGRFMKAIEAGLGAPAALMPGSVVSIVGHPFAASNDNRKSRWQLGGAIAASLMLGLLLGTQFSTGVDGNLTSTALNKALNTVPSTQTVSIAAGESITPQLSFAKAGGGYCRQFSLTGRAGPKTGVACQKDGGWAIEALMPRVQAASAEGGYVTAEGPIDTGIETVIGTLRAGNPLDAAAETKVIARGWK